jgi:hypothetical protein
MVEGTTRSGFAFEVDDQIANDMELFEALCDLDGGDMRALVPVCRKVLGGRKAELYEHLRQPDGRVPVDKVTEEIADIIGAVKDGKKS